MSKDLTFLPTLATRRSSQGVTASRLIEDFERLGLVIETTGWKRNRRYRYEPYIRLFDSQAAPDTEVEDPANTQAAVAATNKAETGEG